MTTFRFICGLSDALFSAVISSRHSRRNSFHFRQITPGADPDSCFGRGTLDLSRRRRRNEMTKVWGGRGLGGDLPPLQSTKGLGERHKLLQRGLRAISGHYIRHFCDFMHVLVHFEIQLARLTKPTRSDHFRRLLVWRGHVPPVPPSGSAHGSRSLIAWVLSTVLRDAAVQRRRTWSWKSIVTAIQGGPKKWTPNALHITSSNVGQF